MVNHIIALQLSYTKKKQTKMLLLVFHGMERMSLGIKVP